MKYILQTFQRLQKRVQPLWKKVEVNISDLGLSFDWRKQDRNASNSSQSFKIFSSSLGKSCCSAAPAAIENESFWPKEQKNRNDDNLGLINRRGFHKRVPERYFHMDMEAKDIPRCIHRWCNISQKSFPGCDDPKQNGVYLREKGKWSSIVWQKTFKLTTGHTRFLLSMRLNNYEMACIEIAMYASLL